MNLFINGSNREKNNYKILKDLMTENDELISLSHKDIKYCLGCNACINKLVNFCVLNDYMTTEIYKKLKEADKIIISSPIYMNQITGLLKNVIDRLNPFSNHGYFDGKKIYLILTGQMSYEENVEEVKKIIDYFSGVSEFMNFEFQFLKYISSGDITEIDDAKLANSNYDEIIAEIKEILK